MSTVALFSSSPSPIQYHRSNDTNNMSGDYSFQLTSFLPPQTDPNQPPAQVQIAVNLNDTRTSSGSNVPMQIHDLTSRPVTIKSPGPQLPLSPSPFSIISGIGTATHVTQPSVTPTTRTTTVAPASPVTSPSQRLSNSGGSSTDAPSASSSPSSHPQPYQHRPSILTKILNFTPTYFKEPPLSLTQVPTTVLPPPPSQTSLDVHTIVPLTPKSTDLPTTVSSKAPTPLSTHPQSLSSIHVPPTTTHVGTTSATSTAATATTRPPSLSFIPVPVPTTATLSAPTAAPVPITARVDTPVSSISSASTSNLIPPMPPLVVTTTSLSVAAHHESKTSDLESEVVEVMSRLDQTHRDFLESQFSTNPQQRDLKAESKAQEHLILTDSNYRPSMKDYIKDPKTNILVQTLPIDPNSMKPITTQTIVNASPNKRKENERFNLHPNRPESEFSTMTQQSDAPPFLSSLPLPSFMTPLTPSSSVNHVSGTMATSSPSILEKFLPNFHNHIDSAPSSTTRNLFGPAATPSPIAQSPSNAAPSSLITSNMQPLVGFGQSTSNPSEEVADLFRRSKANRTRTNPLHTTTVKEEDSEGEMRKTFSLWNVARESSTRLAHALSGIQTMPSFTEFLVKSTPNAVLSKTTEIATSTSQSIATSQPPPTSTEVKSQLEPPTEHAQPSQLSQDSTLMSSAASTTAIDKSNNSEEMHRFQQRQQALMNQSEQHASHQRMLAERRRLLALEEQKQQRLQTQQGDRNRASPETNATQFAHASHQRTHSMSSQLSLPSKSSLIPLVADDSSTVGADEHHQLAELVLAVEKQLDALQRFTKEQPLTPLTQHIQRQLDLIEQRIRSKAYLHTPLHEENVLQELHELGTLIRSTSTAATAASSPAPSKVHVRSSSQTSQPCSSPAASLRPASVSQRGRTIPAPPGSSEVSNAPSSVRSTPQTSRAPSSVPSENGPDETFEGETNESKSNQADEYQYRIDQYQAALKRQQPQVIHTKSLKAKAVKLRSVTQSSAADDRLSFEHSRSDSVASSFATAPRSSIRSSISRHASLGGDSEFILVPVHNRQASTLSKQGEPELAHEVSRFETNAVGKIDESTHEEDEEDQSPLSQEQTRTHEDLQHSLKSDSVTSTSIISKPVATGHGLPLSTREIRALVRSEVLGSPAILRAKYSYLPPPVHPIPLTRVQMLQQAQRAKKGLGETKTITKILSSRAHATSASVRKNIEAMLEREMKERLSRDEEEESKEQSYERFVEPLSHSSPYPSHSHLTLPSFSPSKYAEQATNEHVDALAFDRGTPTIPRTPLQPKSIIPTTIVRKPTASPSKSSVPSLLTAFRSDEAIESHLQQLFALSKLQIQPIERKPSNPQINASSSRPSSSGWTTPTDLTHARATDSSGHQRSQNSTLNSSSSDTHLQPIPQASQQQQQSEYSQPPPLLPLSLPSTTSLPDQLATMNQLTSSAIVFPSQRQTANEPPSDQSIEDEFESESHISTHLELRPIGVILSPTQ